jgi:hypothetical protein
LLGDAIADELRIAHLSLGLRAAGRRAIENRIGISRRVNRDIITVNEVPTADALPLLRGKKAIFVDDCFVSGAILDSTVNRLVGKRRPESAPQGHFQEANLNSP